jgi:hypothetical protein
MSQSVNGQEVDRIVHSVTTELEGFRTRPDWHYIEAASRHAEELIALLERFGGSSLAHAPREALAALQRASYLRSAAMILVAGESCINADWHRSLDRAVGAAGDELLAVVVKAAAVLKAL